MSQIYTNDSGHEMDEVDFMSFLKWKRTDLEEQGVNQEEIEIFLSHLVNDY